jgi:hypothetical protein
MMAVKFIGIIIASAADRGRLEAFLRCSTRFSYRATLSPTLASIIAEADDKLFSHISCNSRHLLYPLLPPKHDEHYNTRDHSHNFQLPPSTSSLNDNNFLTRMLYKDLGYSDYSLRTDN